VSAPDAGHIRRAPKIAGRFTQILNDVLRDKRLSRGARGLHHEMLSYPPDTRITIDMLLEGGPEGLTALRSQLKELEGAGYVIRERQNLGGGRYAWNMVVGETPEEARAAVGKPSAGCPSVENPPMVPPAQTPVSPAHTIDRFPIDGEPADKDLKDVDLPKTVKKFGGDPPPEAPAPCPDGPEMIRHITRQMQTHHRKNITPGQARIILGDIQAKTKPRPDTNWFQVVATCIRREQHLERWLPTNQPDRFIAPAEAPVITERTTSAVEEARAKLAAIRASSRHAHPDPIPVGSIIQEAAA